MGASDLNLQRQHKHFRQESFFFVFEIKTKKQICLRTCFHFVFMLIAIDYRLENVAIYQFENK